AVLPFNENDDEVADTFTGGIATISASSTWQTIGSVSRAASAYNGGVFDVYCRIRDASALVNAPVTAIANASPGIEWTRFARDNGSVSATATFSTPAPAGSFLVALATSHTGQSLNTPAGFSVADEVVHGGGSP